jgi:hypothetical protein
MNVLRQACGAAAVVALCAAGSPVMGQDNGPTWPRDPTYWGSHAAIPPWNPHFVRGSFMPHYVVQSIRPYQHYYRVPDWWKPQPDPWSESSGHYWEGLGVQKPDPLPWTERWGSGLYDIPMPAYGTWRGYQCAPATPYGMGPGWR